MFEKRAKILFILFFILSGITLYFLFERMVLERKEFLRTPYVDRPFVGLMESLVAESVFRIDGEQIVIDENALSNRHLKQRTEKRVRNSLPLLYIKDGRVCFDKQSFSIVNSGPSDEEIVLRGKFIDRNGVVLARSDISRNSWRQERKYTYGPEFYPIIGHSNPVFGKRNLEKALDLYLMGKKHAPLYSATSDPLRPVKIGDDVILTVDSRIQRCAYCLMQGKRGAVVVLDVKRGDILAAVSTPSLDPNTGSGSGWRAAFMDERERPFENRAFSVLYPPGSTFKTVVVSAWLEKRDAMDSSYSIVCTGSENRFGISDIHVHGRVGLAKAFAESCNLFFSGIGVKLGRDILDYAERFGFNRTITLLPRMENLSYSPEISRAFSWPGSKKEKNVIKTYSDIDFRRNPKIVAQAAIGQNLITATPLQLAIIVSGIANKGLPMNPSIIKEIRTGNGAQVVFTAEPVAMGRAIKETTASEVKRLMEEVMENGTGKNVKKIYCEDGRYTTCPKDKKAAVKIGVAGKTGTAEVGDRNRNGQIDPDEKPHSWFIGFAPADNPKVAIAVIAENQGFGSLTAAPIAMDVIAEALNQGGPGR